MVQNCVFAINGGDGCRGIAAVARTVSAECVIGKTWNEKRL
jgi:hypothetical protein